MVSRSRSQGSTLDDMIRLGLVEHQEAIEETCINAQKEYSLEKVRVCVVAPSSCTCVSFSVFFSFFLFSPPRSPFTWPLPLKVSAASNYCRRLSA